MLHGAVFELNIADLIELTEKNDELLYLFTSKRKSTDLVAFTF